MNMQQEGHPTDLLPAYALACLDPEEQAQVEAHLGTCQECRLELAAYHAVAGHLGLAAPEVEAPAGLRQPLLDQARRPKTVAEGPAAARWWQLPGLALRQLLAGPLWRPVVVALILLLAAGNAYLWQRIRQLESQAPAYLRTVNLRGTDEAPDARGVIVIGRDGRSGALVVDGLPALGPEQQYQLWLVRDEERVSGAIFSVNDDGYAPVPIVTPEDLSTYTRIGITIEPAGGSPGPTGAAVLRISSPGATGN